MNSGDLQLHNLLQLFRRAPTTNHFPLVTASLDAGFLFFPCLAACLFVLFLRCVCLPSPIRLSSLRAKPYCAPPPRHHILVLLGPSHPSLSKVHRPTTDLFETRLCEPDISNQSALARPFRSCSHHPLLVIVLWGGSKTRFPPSVSVPTAANRSTRSTDQPPGFFTHLASKNDILNISIPRPRPQACPCLTGPDPGDRIKGGFFGR